MNKVEPITPREARESKVNYIPEEVIAAFNELISTHFRNGEATVMQDEVVELILEKTAYKYEREDIFKKGWLDVEDVFEQYGWTVEYDKPGYCEDYKAYFIFTEK